jgi:parvulin-like peptidyl-prolyl isomerase
MKKIIIMLMILLVLTACVKPVEKQEAVEVKKEEPVKNETVEEKEPVKNETVEEKEEKVEIMAKKVRAKHILVKTEEEANAILYDLKNGKDFDEIAKEKSTCPSGKKGGDLGWFGRGMMVKEFETAAFSLDKDELSKPVKTQFGWHIIKVIEKE